MMFILREIIFFGEKWVFCFCWKGSAELCLGMRDLVLWFLHRRRAG